MAGVGDLLGELTSAWRHTGLGSTAAPPPVLGMMAAIGTVLLGATGLAQTLVVVGAFVLGALGAFRLVRGMGGAHGAAGVAAIAYGISAVPRNAVAGGRLGPLVLYALLPHIVLLVVRSGRFPGLVGTARRSLLGLVIVTAVAGAWYPPALAVAVVVAVTLVIAGLFVGGAVAGLRCVGAALVGVGGALVLLMPWSAELVERATTARWRDCRSARSSTSCRWSRCEPGRMARGSRHGPSSSPRPPRCCSPTVPHSRG